jgi:hypothetical protein
MPFDYQKAQKTALKLIANFGRTIPLVRLASEYDPVTGEESEITSQAATATVVSLPNGSGSNFDNRFKEDFKAGKIRFFYVAAKGLNFEPAPGDIFVFENKVWDVAGSTPLNPAGVPVLYTMAGRVSGKTLVDYPETLPTTGDCNDLNFDFATYVNNNLD